MHKRAIDRSEVILEGSSQGQPHINDSISSQRKHVVLEILVKEVFSLVHDFLAHDDVELAALVSSLLSIAEIVFNDLDNGSLLVTLISELVQDRSKGRCCCTRHSGHSILAEFEEHRQKVRVYDASIEERSVLAEVLSKHLFSAPVRASLINRLSDVLDVRVTLDLRHLSKEDVQILHDAESHVWVVVP